jgi:hypothetical protein
MSAFLSNEMLTSAAELLTCFFTLVAAMVSYIFTWRA